MAQQEVQLDDEKFCCSICLDLLKDPVSVSCGHNYCSRCIDRYWNQRNQRGRFSCPQCRQTFNPRPDLKKNIMLADMMDILKKARLQVVPPEHCYAGPGDVACDFCTGRKLKAVKTCLQCLVSYCDIHLQPHYQSPAFKNHKLVNASTTLQENICSHHDEVRKLFCRTDQQCICYLCSMEEHKGHNIISAAAEKTERHKELDMSQQNIKQRIQKREKEVKVIHQELKSINHCADRAVEESDTVFTELITSIKGRRYEVRKLIRNQQKHEVSRAEEQRKCVEQEVTELRRRHAELEQISHTTDHIHFLNSSTSLSRISESTHPVSSNVRPLRYFEDVAVAVSKMRDKLEDILKEDGTDVSATVNRVDILLLPTPEPKFLQKNKLEDFIKIKQIKRVLVVILFFVITWTHPIRSSVQPQWTHREQLGVPCTVREHLNTNPGWLGFWLGSTPPEPKSRAEFVQYSCPITLDPNTVHGALSLSKGNRKVITTEEQKPYPRHPERFTAWPQVLSREGLTGRCYWEVEWSGIYVDIAVSYKDIPRWNGPIHDDSLRFGRHDTSWAFHCEKERCFFAHVVPSTQVYTGRVSSRLGVYLDHSAGTLSLYNVSDTMALLHRAQTTFTQTLYAGFLFWSPGDTAELSDLTQHNLCDPM